MKTPVLFFCARGSRCEPQLLRARCRAERPSAHRSGVWVVGGVGTLFFGQQLNEWARRPPSSEGNRSPNPQFGRPASEVFVGVHPPFTMFVFAYRLSMLPQLARACQKFFFPPRFCPARRVPASTRVTKSLTRLEPSPTTQRVPPMIQAAK